MTTEIFPNRLFLSVARNPETLSIRLDFEMLVEFAVAAKIQRARSVSSFVHQYVVAQILEARSMVAPAEWQRLVEEQKTATLARSRNKAKSRLTSERGVNGNIEPVPDSQVAYVEHLGELTNETAKDKRQVKKKAGGGRR